MPEDSKKASQRGQVGIDNLFRYVVIVVLVAAALSILVVVATSSAKSKLQGEGYVVLAAEEYDAIITKLDDIKAAALAAVTNANNAVTAAQNAVTAAQNAAIAAQTAADKVDLFNTADTFLFTDNTTTYCLLAADAAVNNFSAWREIKDNTDATLSAKFLTKAGYISDIYIYQVTAPANTVHIVEIAYGASKVSLTRIMFDNDNMNIAQIKSRRIPAGEMIYYRIMTNTAPTEYVSIGFRYFYE